MDLQTIPEKNTQHPHFAKSLVKFVALLMNDMRIKLSLLLLAMIPGQLFAQESGRIENFVLMENLIRNDKLAIIATDTDDIPNESVSGTYQFIINGFKQELAFNEGVAITPQAIDKSTFVFVKHQNQNGSVGKLYFLYKSDQGFKPIHINWIYLILIPAVVLLFGYMFKRLLIWAVIVLIILFIFNYQKGLDLTNIFETIVHGIRGFLG